MTRDDPLIRLAASTASTAVEVLRTFCGDRVSAGTPSVIAHDADPFEALPMPAVIAQVAYVDGVTGGNVFVMTPAGARRLAAAMVGSETPEELGDAELDELELSAVAEAMNQMMAGAATATSRVLGTAVEIAPPETKLYADLASARADLATATHTTSTTLVICGEPCRLIQLVPNAFVVRIGQALDDLREQHAVAGVEGEPVTGAQRAELERLVRGTQVRVWAELGRTRMATGTIVGLPEGAVVELDRMADEPVELYVNGMCFASGRLVVADGTDWAVAIDTVHRSRLPELSPDPTREGEAI